MLLDTQNHFLRNMTFLNLPLIYFSTYLLLLSFLTQSKSKIIETHKQLLIIEQVLQLFEQDLFENHCNFIFFDGTNKSNRSSELVREYIREKSYYNRFTPGTTIIQSLCNNITDGDSNEDVQNILSPPILKNDVIPSTVFIIQSYSLHQLQRILSTIGLFYKNYPERSSTICVFIAWQWAIIENVNEETNTTSHNPKAIDFLKRSIPNIPVNSHLYLLTENHHSYSKMLLKVTWEIWEFYNINGKYVLSRVKNSTRDFFQIFKRRKNFRGTLLRGVEQRDVQLSFTSQEARNSTNSFTGQLWFERFMKPTSQNLNFRLQMIQGEGWILQDSYGRLTGMGKQLISKEADLSVSASEMLPYRIQSLDASLPSHSFEVKAYFRQPPPFLFRDIFLEAFSLGLWVVMAITWFIIILCLVVFSFIKKQYSQSTCSEYDEMIARDAVYWALSAVCQTGWHYTPTSTSLQIVFICGLLASLLYYTAYSASIISIFSVELNKIQTFSDLRKYGFTLYANVISLTEHDFVKEQAERDGVRFESRLVNASVALNKIENSRAAYISSHHLFFMPAISQKNKRNNFCGFVSESRGFIEHQYGVMYYRKHDALKKFMNLELIHWKETGLLHRFNTEYNRLLPAPCEPKRKEPEPLEFQDIQTAFFVLGLGFVGCICILMYEVTSNVRKKDPDSVYIVRTRTRTNKEF